MPRQAWATLDKFSCRAQTFDKVWAAALIEQASQYGARGGELQIPMLPSIYKGIKRKRICSKVQGLMEASQLKMLDVFRRRAQLSKIRQHRNSPLIIS